MREGGGAGNYQARKCGRDDLDENRKVGNEDEIGRAHSQERGGGELDEGDNKGEHVSQNEKDEDD